VNPDYEIISVQPIEPEYFPRSHPFRIFFDTNVLLDIILKNGRYTASVRLFDAFNTLFDSGLVEFYTSTTCIVEAIYQLGDFSLLSFKGKQLIQELAENLDNPENIKNILKNSTKDIRSQIDQIPNVSKLFYRAFKILRFLLEKYDITITPVSLELHQDSNLVMWAYKNNLQIQDFLVLLSALAAESDMLITNDIRFQKRTEKLGDLEDIENYIVARSLVNYKATKLTLHTLRDEGVISEFKVIMR